MVSSVGGPCWLVPGLGGSGGEGSRSVARCCGLAYYRLYPGSCPLRHGIDALPQKATERVSARQGLCESGALEEGVAL